MMKFNALATTLVGVSIATSTAAVAAEPVTLKIAHVYPANHYHWEQGLKPFTEGVTSRTNGAVQFEIYPSGQLGKDQVSLLQYGIADIALLVPSLQTDKLPLMSVAELPGLYSSACDATAKLSTLVQGGSVLSKEELQPNGIHPLYSIMLAPYPILTKDRQILDVKDLSGIKLRANGAAIGETFRELGAVPVQVGATDLYNAATRGTVDGAYFPYTAVPTYSLEKTFQYALEGLQLGSGGAMLAVSDRVWNDLPDDVKKIMAEEAASAQKSYCNWLDQNDREMRDELAAKYGMTVTVASGELTAKVNELATKVGDQWAKRMDEAGKKGSEVLTAFKQATTSTQ